MRDLRTLKGRPVGLEAQAMRLRPPRLSSALVPTSINNATSSCACGASAPTRHMVGADVAGDAREHMQARRG